MSRIRLFAGALAAAGLTGCVMLPPPPPMFHRPPPGVPGEAGPMPSGDAHRRPPGRDMHEVRCAPGEADTPDTPDTQMPGAR